MLWCRRFAVFGVRCFVACSSLYGLSETRVAPLRTLQLPRTVDLVHWARLAAF